MNKKLLQIFLIFNLGINNMYTTHTVNQSESKKLTTSNNNNLIQSDQNTNDSLSDTFLDKVKNFVSSELFLYGSAIFLSIIATGLMVKQYQKYNSPDYKINSWINFIKKKYPAITEHLQNAKFLPGERGWAVSGYNDKSDCKPIIEYPTESLNKGFSPFDELALLHEVGHIDFGKKHPFLDQQYRVSNQTTNLNVFIAILLSTKLKSPFFTTFLCGNYSHRLLPGKINENAADNYACKHADKQALLAGSDHFKKKYLSTLEQDKFYMELPDDKKEIFKKLAAFDQAYITPFIQMVSDQHQPDNYRAKKFQKVADAKNI